MILMPVRTGELRIGPERRESRVELPFSGLADRRWGQWGTEDPPLELAKSLGPTLSFPLDI